MKSKVFIRKCDSYDLDKIIAILRPIVKEIKENTNLFQAGDKVFLKVNLLCDRTPEQFTTTHPTFTQAVIHLLREYGCEMIIGDSASGRFNPTVLKHLYDVTGYLKLSKEENIPLNYDCSSTTIEGIIQVKAMHDADYVIGLGKLKSHSMMTYTGAAKLCYGSVPGELKAVGHALHPSKKRFASYICDICDVLNPRLTLIDGIWGMQGNGPSNGYLYEANLIAAAENPYALDKTLTSMLKIPMALLPIETEAKKRQKYDEIEVDSEIDELPEFALADSIKTQKLPFPFFNKNKCVGCGICANACPQKTIQIIDHKAVFDNSKCIRCYCCQEVCPKNAIDLK